VTRSDVFRAGDVLNGYRLLEDFRVVGAGLSEWSFAERGGRIFFIKRFLSPTYPEADAPGSERTKAKKRARCAAFEAHHRGIQAAMAPLTTYGGNLIATLDFFRIGAKYYKVTEKVDVAGLQPRDVAALDFPTQLVLLKTVAHSLKILHDLRIVHSDLKPSNVLIKRTELGYTTKLIDFDSSYIVGSPPPPDEIVGTMNYYSPELVRYIQGSATPGELTEASDIFALGLIYAEYLTGAMPPFDPAHHEAAIAVLHGQPLKLGPSVAPPLVIELVERMLLLDPAARPSVAQVHSTLMSLRSGAAPSTTARAPVPIHPPVVPRDSSRTAAPRRAPGGGPSVLRGKGVRIASGSSAAGTPAPSESGHPAEPRATKSDRASGRSGGLLGKLIGKRDERRTE
jgi:eukaryotic-like serine/threonine-protein kinase